MVILGNCPVAVKALENFIIATEILDTNKQLHNKDRQTVAWSCPNPSGLF